MKSEGLHLHAMVVHAVIALAVLGAGGYLLWIRATAVEGADPRLWALLVRGSLLGVLVIAVPGTITGITSRNHMYANWHRTHRVKLVLSLLLLATAAAALAGVLRSRPDLESWPAVLVVVVIPGLALALALYGLRITLGRASLARTSYLPDMFKNPPVDILELAAEHAAEDPRLVDPTQELDQ